MSRGWPCEATTCALGGDHDDPHAYDQAQTHQAQAHVGGGMWLRAGAIQIDDRGALTPKPCGEEWQAYGKLLYEVVAIVEHTDIIDAFDYKQKTALQGACVQNNLVPSGRSRTRVPS